jgi:hypothetical protein
MAGFVKEKQILLMEAALSEVFSSIAMQMSQLHEVFFSSAVQMSLTLHHFNKVQN